MILINIENTVIYYKMTFFKYILQNGQTKIINLSTVRTISLNKNIIRFDYNLFNLSGNMIVASGDIESKPVYDEINYEDNKLAEEVFEKIQKKLELV